MRAKAKYAVIYRHREEYPVSVMCSFFEVSRSGYYSFVEKQGQPEHGIGRSHSQATGEMFPYIRLPEDVDMAGKPGNPP